MQYLRLQTPFYLNAVFQKIVQCANQEPSLTLGLGFGLFTIAIFMLTSNKDQELSLMEVQKKDDEQLTNAKESKEASTKEVGNEPENEKEKSQKTIQDVDVEDEEQEDMNLKIKKSDVHQQDWYRLKSRTFKTAQHRMNGFKEDNSGVDKTDRENKTIKRTPLNRRKAFETDQEVNTFTTKREKIRDLGKDSDIPNDKLFFQLYAKVANEVTDEEDE